MEMTCVDCGAIIVVPEDVTIDEIVSCPDCGLDYVVVDDGSGSMILKELVIEGEDWGE